MRKIFCRHLHSSLISMAIANIVSAKYSWHPCTTYFRSAPFYSVDIFFFFTKWPILMRRSRYLGATMTEGEWLDLPDRAIQNHAHRHPSLPMEHYGTLFSNECHFIIIYFLWSSLSLLLSLLLLVTIRARLN